ncbi:hypothetical protein [Mangrovicoccus ximenensis]|uniref:hypothetical protein n=1 Tax=Mangrovicoccus ximenensis TaxID=1911570 RepID=UPI000D3C36C2|nr:hypothetical protein [Mangrovicoccus ximenensis]
MAIATDYKYMKNAGKPPRFEEAFAFKHILNDTDSNPDFLSERRPLDKNGARLGLAGLIQNTGRAYAQAMNRFNTSSASAAFDTILECETITPRPTYADLHGQRKYYLPVERGWKFERIENAFSPPNHTRYEAVLRAQFSSNRVANMSCMGSPGVVNHWDQADNMAWFS